MERAGLAITSGRVLPDWIDLNEHMNVAYYLLAFARAVDALWEIFGLTEEYVRTHSSSTIAVESHVAWKREVFEGDPYVVTAQVLAYDEKRIHQFQRMYHAGEGYLAATCEWMNLHFDTGKRRVAPWPDDVLARIARFAGEQGAPAWPAEAGRRMQVKTPLFSVRREAS
ncbi:MAG: thioesterase family protein [Proteobacteria bacterium]|nr:thioesterase family protein [Pseudomonadota bacterium]